MVDWRLVLYCLVGPLLIGVGVVAARRYSLETNGVRKAVSLVLILIGTLVTMFYGLILLWNLLLFAGVRE